MHNYNDGYIVDISYDCHFFTDITPNFIRTLLLLKGIDLPARKQDEPLRYLELGYGQGISLNVHAASNAGEFWGTDFNPQHSLGAKKALHDSKINVQILNDSFAELEAKADNGTLPQFDLIVMHGIWSWISPDNQRSILNIISKNLKVGGVVYVSYNCMPGWASFIPVRELLCYHAESYSDSTKSSVSKIQSAYSFISTMEKCGASYFNQNPVATNKFKKLESQSISYLAHEYLNKNWDIPYFKDVAADFESVKCSFISSTRLLTQLPISLPPEILPMLNEITDVNMRETIRDFALNTQFRCDLFVKGKNALNQSDLEKEFSNLQFALLCQAENVNYSITGPRGAMQCKEEIYRPLVSYLAENNYQPKTVQSMKNLDTYKNMELGSFVEIISVLMAAGYIHPAQDATEQQQESCKHINTFFCEQSLEQDYAHVLASPKLGGGFQVSRIEQIFLHAQTKGHQTPGEYADFAHKLLDRQGWKMTVDQKTLTSQEALEHLQTTAVQFEKTRLPHLEALGIALL